MFNNSPTNHGTTPEQFAIASKISEMLENKRDSEKELRNKIYKIIGNKNRKPKEQWTNDQWSALADVLGMQISFYR